MSTPPQRFAGEGGRQPNSGAGKTLLGMFAKWWRPGDVKTRLATKIGAQAAARFHELAVRTLLQRMQNAGDDRWLCVSPAESIPRFAALAAGWEVRPQAEGNLGRRMEAFFREGFAAGAERVVLIGSDSPALPLEWIGRAFQELEHQPVVLGPAEDGGYYLIGARAGEPPPIFEDIPWSTAQVWRATTQRLEAAKIGWSVLPKAADVDTWEDLVALKNLLLNRPAQADAAEFRPLLDFLKEIAP